MSSRTFTCVCVIAPTLVEKSFRSNRVTRTDLCMRLYSDLGIGEFSYYYQDRYDGVVGR